MAPQMNRRDFLAGVAAGAVSLSPVGTAAQALAPALATVPFPDGYVLEFGVPSVLTGEIIRIQRNIFDGTRGMFVDIDGPEGNAVFMRCLARWREAVKANPDAHPPPNIYPGITSV